MKKQLSLEAHVESSQETEIALFGQITNRDVLETADDVIIINEYKALLGKDNYCRLRVTKDKAGKVLAEYTIKVPLVETEGNLATKKEYNYQVDQDFIDWFISNANESCNKTRYIFKVKDYPARAKVSQDVKSIPEDITISEMIVEVDVFKGTDWVKIDIELDSIIDSLKETATPFLIFDIVMEKIPVKMTDYFLHDKSDEVKENKVKELFQNYFNKPL